MGLPIGRDDVFGAAIDGLGSIPTEPLIVLLALGVAWYGSRLFARLIEPNVTGRFERQSIANVTLRGARLAFVLAGLFVALGLIGVDVSNLFLSVTVLSVVLGVILAPVASDVISGFFVLVNRPYEIGDMIEIVDEGKRGYVDDITLRYTKIITVENTFLVIPNSTIHNRDVINYSGDDERTRASIEFTVTYEGDLEEARRLAERAARNTEGVIEGGPGIRIGKTRYPAQPRALIEEFAGRGVRLSLRFWIEKPYVPAALSSEIHENLWRELDGADVDLAYPRTHHVFDETSGEVQVELDSRSARAVVRETSAD